MRKMNSQRSQISTIAIVLLVVGLVVGAIGGYFAVQPKIDDYKSQAAALNSEIAGLGATVSSLEDEITGYESQVFNLIGEITVLETLTSDMQGELDELEGELDELEGELDELETDLDFAQEEVYLLETRIEGLEDAIEWYQGALFSAEAEVARLQVLFTDTFTMYGFSFEYPEGWMVSTYGLFESMATENSGVVTTTSPDEESGYTVGWMFTVQVPDLEKTIDDSLDGMISEYPDIELGERVTVVIGEYGGAEHFQKFQSGTSHGYGLMFTVWYCDVSDYVFLVVLVEPEPADMFSILAILMEGFECH